MSPFPSLQVVKVFVDKQSPFSWWSIILHCLVCAWITADCWCNGLATSTAIKKKSNAYLISAQCKILSLYLCMAPIRPWISWRGPTTKQKDLGCLWPLNPSTYKALLIWSQLDLSLFQSHLLFRPSPQNDSFSWPAVIFFLFFFFLLLFCSFCPNAHLCSLGDTQLNATSRRSILRLPQIFTVLFLYVPDSCPQKAEIILETSWCWRC